VSQLAFNYKGKRIILPPEARHWRVQRLRDGQRGQLDVVRNREGVPLTIPIETETEAFPALVEHRPGHYRLVAVDEELMELEVVPAAYVTVPGARGTPELVESERLEVLPVPREAMAAATPAQMVTAPFGTWPALPMPGSLSGAEYLLGETIRGQVLVMQTMVASLGTSSRNASDGASQMIGAATDLVRAADGAAMPRRVPRDEPRNALPAPTVEPPPLPVLPFFEDFELEEEEDEGAPAKVEGEDVPLSGMLGSVMKAASMVSKVVTPIAESLGTALGPIATLVRGHAPVAEAQPRNASAPPAGEARAAGPPDDEPDGDDADDAAPMMTPAMHSHVVLIGQQLGPDTPLLRRVLQAMDASDRHALVSHWCALSVQDAADDAAERLAPIKVRLERRRARAAEAAAVEQDAPAAAGESGPSAVPVEVSEDVDVDVALDPPPTVPRPTKEPAARVSPEPKDRDQHLLDVMARLSFTDITLAQQLITELPQAERDRWMQKLARMSVEDAAATVRNELARRRLG
jgi:hypothetical protein